VEHKKAAKSDDNTECCASTIAFPGDNNGDGAWHCADETFLTDCGDSTEFSWDAGFTQFAALENSAQIQFANLYKIFVICTCSKPQRWDSRLPGIAYLLELKGCVLYLCKQKCKAALGLCLENLWESKL